MELDKIYNMDCMEGMKSIPDGSVDLAIIDPPYNVSVTTYQDGIKKINAWDRIENYQDWMLSMLQEVSRCLKDNGVLYLWHNDMTQIPDLLVNIKANTNFSLRSFCIWDKGESYRARTWKNRKQDGATPLRSWFNVCEYCLHFFNGKDRNSPTGLEMIHSNPDCFSSLKEWYKSEKERLGLTQIDIKKAYCEATGKGDGMLRHYFQNSQFELPTKDVWEKVFKPLGFLREYEDLRREYEDLRREYEDLRHTHHVDFKHCNIWHRAAEPTNNRYHTCQKPLEIIERLIRVSSNEGETVLDNCMGSGTTAVAAINTNRHFIGFEKEKEYYDIALKRIEGARMQIKLIA